VTRESALEGVFREQVKRHLPGAVPVKLAPIIAGLPDRMVLLPHGRVVFVELKTSTGRLRPVQQVWHRRMADLGHPVTVLHGAAEIRAWAAAAHARYYAGHANPTRGDHHD